MLCLGVQRCVSQVDTIQQYNIRLLPSVNTLTARGMFCGAKYTHHTWLDPYTPLKDNQTVRSTKAFHNVKKNNNNTPSVSGTFVSVFLPLCRPPSQGHPSRRHPSRGHPSRRHPSRGLPSSRLRRPRRTARTNIPKMERHEDGGSIRLSYPSQEHPPLPSSPAIQLK